MFGGLIAMARRQKMFEPVADPLCVSKTSSVVDLVRNRLTTSATMIALIFLILNLAAALFKSKSRLEAENAALRHQLTVLQGKVRGRVQFTNSDRLFFIQLYRWFPSNPYPRAGIYPVSLHGDPLH